jgi:uncharacterized protein DUF1963
MDRVAAEARIRGAFSEATAREVVAALRPAARLKATPCPDPAALGASRFGGLPDLPTDLEWPVGTAGAPLAFLAQIRCSDLSGIAGAQNLVPSCGTLYFFHDTAGQWTQSGGQGGRVEYGRDEGSLLIRAEPAVQRADVFRTCALQITREWTLPASRFFEDDGEARAYDRLLGELYGGGPVHRIGGWPVENQDHPAEDCVVERRLERARLGVRSLPGTAAGDWELLLQLDTDEEGPGWVWGDLGHVFFMGTREELAAGRLDRVMLRLQTY